VFAENLSYALVQVVHNFGAAGVVALPLFAIAAARTGAYRERSLLWLVLLAWSTQVLSGAGFGAVSYYFYTAFPELSRIATVALVIKVASAILALILVGVALRRDGQGATAPTRPMWHALAGLGVVALTAAAFLRWFA
jgi:hypothetical protein